MKFVIYAYTFDDRNGGAVVLHLLCQRLAEAGETALIWRAQPRFHFWPHVGSYVAWLRYYVTGQHRRYSMGPFDNEVATDADLPGAVVIYPEVVPGNPLKAGKVVRWLLHKPGFHSGQVEFGDDDLFFYYQDAFLDPALEQHRGNRLTLTWWNKEYRQFNHGDRSGSCYLVKKGRGRPIVHDLHDSVLIDALSHREKAQAFNKAKYFYTYDPYTLFSRYAALCGCIPIIVPQAGMTREQWVAREEERYGLAYGDAEVEWAVATRALLLRQIEREQATEAAMLQSFIEKCRARFS